MISRTFESDYTFSETDSYTIIIVQHPELKCDATQVEIDDTRYVSCLSVVPLVMDATCLKHRTNNAIMKFDNNSTCSIDNLQKRQKSSFFSDISFYTSYHEDDKLHNSADQ